MEWSTVILTVMVGIAGICFVLFGRSKKFQRLGVLHEKPWPFLGNLAPAIFRRCSVTENVDRIYRLYENADYVGFYNMMSPVILIRSPELIKSIAIKNFDHFVDHLPIGNPDLDPLFTNHLGALRGERWKEVRNLLTPAFTSSKIKAMFNLMSDCAKNFSNYLVVSSIDEPTPIDTKECFARYTNDVIATCAFGITVDSMKNPKNDFYVIGRDVANFEGLRSLKLFSISVFPKISSFLKLRLNPPSTEKFFESVVRETIETRDRDGVTRPDMIQLMMESRGNKPGEGPRLTVKDMTAQAFVFFFGGFDSTSTVMCFVAHEIAVNEDVQNKLHDEIDEVMEETGGELTYEALNKMRYLDAVINEALRMYPVGPFLDRVCVKRFELPPAFSGGEPLIVEPGDNLWIPVYSVQRDAKYFSDPEKFDPDRFTDDGKKEIDPCTYVPFGIGPRMCIGNRFAMLEIKVVLFYLLAKCRLRPSTKTLVPLELSKTSFLVTAKGGFWLQFEPRRNE